MLHFKHPVSGEVFAYDSQIERDAYGDSSLVSMADAEVQAYLNPSPPAAAVPQSISRFQAYAVLAQAGKFTAINDFMLALPVDDVRRLAWLHAAEFERQSPMIIAMSGQFGISDAELDNLFTVGAGIKA